MRQMIDRPGEPDAEIVPEIGCSESAGFRKAIDVVHCQILDPAFTHGIRRESGGDGVERSFDGEMGMPCAVLIYQRLQISI